MTASPPKLKRIIVVEDHDSVRELLSRKFRAASFHVDPAEDLFTAVSLLEHPSEPFDIGIFDLTMPSVGPDDPTIDNGVRVMKTARDLYPKLPIVVISSKLIDPKTRADLESMNVKRIFRKPLILDEVRDYVMTLLHES